MAQSKTKTADTLVAPAPVDRTVDRAALEAFAQSPEVLAAAAPADAPPTLAELIQKAAPRADRPFVPEIEDCPRHGRWEVTVLRADGVVGRHAQCPACGKEGRLRAALGQSGIPDRFQTLTLDTYSTELAGEMMARDEAWSYVHDFAEVGAKGHCLIFHGMYGTGKTHLACGIGLGLIAKGYSVAHFSVLEVVRRWRESWDQGSETREGDVLKAFVDVDFLILEEIGRQKDTEAERGHLFEILDGRYGRNKPTLVTSNYPLEGDKKSIEGFLGQAAYDRLYRNGCTPIEFNWGSFTRRKRP